MHTSIHVSVSGEFEVKVGKMGEQPHTRRVFKNLITDIGLNRMASQTDYVSYVQVGTGSTAPVATNTALAAFVAGVYRNSNPVFYALKADSANPGGFVATTSVTYQFAPGSATGNLAEIGVGWSQSGNLFSRALITDSSGNPTTLTVLADEYLQITYTLSKRIPPPADVVTTATIGGVSRTVTVRPAYLTLGANGDVAWGYAPGKQLMELTSGINGTDLSYAYTGAIGAASSIPGGTRLDLASISNNTYVSGSFKMTGTLRWALGSANNASGIRSVVVASGAGTHQVQFDPPLMKTNTMTLALTFEVSWGRDV